MTSPTRAWVLYRLSDWTRPSMRARVSTACTCTLRRNDSDVIHARAWLAATWLESGWLTLRSTTWLKKMGFEDTFHYHYLNYIPNLNTNLH